MYQWVEKDKTARRLTDGAFIGIPQEGEKPGPGSIEFLAWIAAGGEPQAEAPRAPGALAGDIERANPVSQRALRELVIATLPKDHPERVKAEAAEAQIESLGVRE